MVTTAATMAAFRGAFSDFNPFGGNPVSAAAALAVRWAKHIFQA